MFHMTQTKQGISARELSRRIDVTYNTAKKMHHKLRQVMREREAARLLRAMAVIQTLETELNFRLVCATDRPWPADQKH